jgi:Methyltransferase domain
MRTPTPDTAPARRVGDPTATGTVVIGHRLGLYRALADGPLTVAELADHAAAPARPVRYWLRGQVAGGYVAATDDGRFMLAQAAWCLAEPDAAAGPPAAGPGRHEHDEDVVLATEAFFRPGYLAGVATEWLPALGDVAPRLHAGGRIADLGCRLGTSSILMALAHPAALVRGSDDQEGFVELAAERAASAGVGDRVAFEAASASTFTGAGFDLVTGYDCLHGTHDPLSTARRVRSAIAPHGCWMLVEPADDPALDRDPVGRMWALGAPAGSRAVTALAREAGFTCCEQVAATSLNTVYALRP